MSYYDTYNSILLKQWPENDLDHLTQFFLGLWKFSSQCLSLVLVLIMSVLVLMFTRLVCAATYFCFFAANQSGSSNLGSNLVVTSLPPNKCISFSPVPELIAPQKKFLLPLISLIQCHFNGQGKVVGWMWDKQSVSVDANRLTWRYSFHVVLCSGFTCSRSSKRL